jgi:hypothetical protein
MNHLSTRSRVSFVFVAGALVTALTPARADSKSAPPLPNPPSHTPPAVSKDVSTPNRLPAPPLQPLPTARESVAQKAESLPDAPAVSPPLPPSLPSSVRIRAERSPAPGSANPPAPGVAADQGLTPTGRMNPAIATNLESRTVVPALRSATIETRGNVFTDLESRLNAADSALNSVERSTAEMSAEGRKQFKAASDEAKDRAKALRKSVQAARKANATEWESARAHLAADYEAYAAALARIDQATGVSPRR